MSVTAHSAPNKVATVIETVRDAILEGGIELPPAPQVAVELSDIGPDDGHGAARISQLVQRDAVLAGQVIRIANSAAAAACNPVVTVQQAIVRLGIFEVRAIAFTLAMRQGLFGCARHAGELDALWRMSAGTACCSRELARIRRRNVESAYLAGLVYRLGRALALHEVGRIEQQRGITLDPTQSLQLADELEVMLGVRLALAWHLPAAALAAIAHWRAPEAGGEFVEVASRVRLAHAMAQQLLFPSEMPPTAGVERADLARLNIYPEDLEELCRPDGRLQQLIESQV
jgi:HD-like signal output (HDOD) protein